MQIQDQKPTLFIPQATRAVNAPVTTKTWSDSSVTWSSASVLWGLGDSVDGVFPSILSIGSAKTGILSVGSAKV